MRRVLFVFVVVALVVMAGPPPTFSAPSGSETTSFFRIVAADYADANLEVVRALDYDSFVWAEVMTSDLPHSRSGDLPYQVFADPFTLNLGGQRFDPRQGDPALPAGWDTVRTDGPDLHLVQFAGPTQDAWLDRIRREGLEVVQYIYPFTYVVWGEMGAREAAARGKTVEWTGPFAPAYRVQPRWRNLPEDTVQVDVLLYRGADTGAAVRAIQALGGRRIDGGVLNDTFEIAGFDISGAQLQAAAQIPGVYSIQLASTEGGLRGEMSNQVNMGNVDGDGDAFPGYQDWLAAAGVDGTGIIIANVDNGVDETQTDLVNRMVPCTGSSCGGTTEPTNSHGTHTAGIMAADGSSGITDTYGFLRGLGMAPGANLVEQVHFSHTDPGGLLNLMTESYNNGASVSGNSWGPSDYPVGYDNDTMQVDIGVRDADPYTLGNQPLNYVLSIMNGKGDSPSYYDYSPSSLGSPDEAKNIFAIGATNMQYSSGAQYPDVDDLAWVTAHGPALDGRTVPHMVAPGCSVDSTGLDGDYYIMCGTSMASPHVSGAAALFIQSYRAQFGIDPSPAMVKAAFLPVAHDLAGHRDADGNTLGHPFDRKQGWGRLDAAAVLSPTVPVTYFDNPIIFDNSGEEWTRIFSPADTSQPVRLMLVWTDAPGHGLGGTTPAWNNDLDLVVEAESATYYGNNFGSDGWSQTGGSADYMNNTEGVFLGPTPPDRFTVRVVASNINSEGIPNSGDDTDQDFALVCYNCARTGFSLDTEPGEIDICAPDIATTTISVTDNLTYTHPVTLSVINAPAGVTAIVSPAVVVPTGVATLTLDVGGAATEGSYTLTISGSGANGDLDTDEMILHISTCAPPPPVLLSPADGTWGIPLAADFTWASQPRVQGYHLQVDTALSFSAPVVDVSAITTTSYTLDSPLLEDICYFWRVAADGACGEGEWTFPGHFSTAQNVPEDSPVILDITPRTSPLGAVTMVEITGEHFVSEPLVRLGETWLISTTLVNSTTIGTVVPSTLTLGSYDLALVNGDCQSVVMTDAFFIFSDQIYLPLIMKE